jgi:signal transduction histidine kinase
LTKTIESLIERVEKSTSIKFKTEINEIDEIFPSESEIIIYRIIQECINNIIKHSGATEAELLINKDILSVIINISDVGQGFDLSESEAKGGFGLKGMLERVNLLNGNIKIDSLKGKGTSVQITLPFLN